jgi:iron complex outermembrane receptor protein
MNKNISYHLLSGVAAVAIATPLAFGAANAQDNSQDKSLGLEEIVVTAQKRAQNLQDVPIQVTAFSEQKIEDAGIRTTQDFVNMVPNMSLDDSYSYLNTFVVVRGVTQINNADAPIAIVIDGVPQNSQKQFKMNLYDIERIEVLKGPQGALYGRNAIGGAVNIVTRQPTNEFEGFARASYGNGDAIDLSGGVSGPIVEDKVLFRLAGSYKQDDGRITNTFLNEKVDYIDHDYSFRGQIKVLATERLTFDLRGSYQDFQAGGLYDSAIFDLNDANQIQPPREDVLGKTFGNIKELTFKFDYEADFATLTGITGYTDVKEYNRGDLDFTNPVLNPGGFLGFLGPIIQGQNQDIELFSQELRLVSPSEDPFRWIVGAYYIHTDRSVLTRAVFDIDNTLEQFDDPALRLINLTEDNSNNAYALFAQFDYDITDQLTLSGALRYDEDKRKQTDLTSLLVREQTFDSIQPKATLTYNFNDDQLVYATYSKGFRSGGFNAPTVPIPLFDKEELDNFEAGFKTSWLNNRLVVNGAVYLQKVDNFQFFFLDAATASQVIANIEAVDIFGVELEAQALVAEGLEVFGALGTTDSEIKRSSLFPGFVGNKTPKTTDWTLNAGFQYRFPIQDDLNGLLRVDYEHRGNKYWHVDNLAVQGSLDLVDARAGVEGDNWGVYVWAKNLTDEDYYTDYNQVAFSGLGFYDIGFRAQPRTYGVEGKVNF